MDNFKRQAFLALGSVLTWVVAWGSVWAALGFVIFNVGLAAVFAVLGGYVTFHRTNWRDRT